MKVFDLRDLIGAAEPHRCVHNDTCPHPAYLVTGDYFNAWDGEAYCDLHDPRKVAA